MKNFMQNGLGPLLAGLLLALGLGVSGMTEPAIILAFLDIAGNWDATLIFVILGAISVHFVLYRVIIRRSAPLFDKKFHLPKRTKTDKKLIIGAIIFGVGWGLAGLCPGPGITSLVAGTAYAASFVVAMLFGMFIVKRFV